MRNYRTTFEEVIVTRCKRGKCGCGKSRTRSMKFWQTLNPFNKNRDGSQKSRADILRELNSEADAWAKKPITCDGCENLTHEAHRAKGACQ